MALKSDSDTPTPDVPHADRACQSADPRFHASMLTVAQILPNIHCAFRPACLAAGMLFVALGLSLFAQGSAHGTSVSSEAVLPFDSITQDSSETDAFHDPLDGRDGRIPAPMTRPDYASLWDGVIVDITSPASRPDLIDILPESTPKLDEMIRRETGQDVHSEQTLTLSQGGTLAKILLKANFTRQDVASVSQALSNHLDLHRLQVGTKFTAGLDHEDKALAVKVSLPAGHQSAKKIDGFFVDHYVWRSPANQADDGWQAIRAVRPVDRIAVHAGNQIDLSLYESAMAVNIPLEALDAFVRVMSFSIDFQRDIQPGDQFEMVYEDSVDRLTGDILSAGELQYAGIITSGKRFGFYRFVHPDGRIGWYDQYGESAVRTLMRTPVNGARLSSRYGMRRHPITGFNAMHRGIDFAVPTGTPVLAAGTGHIETAGWNGNYGKYIRIRHNSTYKTAYAHLSQIKAGIRRGTMVQQGEVIGYVGSTGRSTGPHLHYEILVNNRHLNPLTVKLPSGDRLPDELKEAFSSQVAAVRQKMKGSRTPDYAGVTLQQAALSQ